jgi:hypothetical protein
MFVNPLVAATGGLGARAREKALRQSVRGFTADLNSQLTIIQMAAEEILGYCEAGDPVRPLILELARASERAAYLNRLTMQTVEDFRVI